MPSQSATKPISDALDVRRYYNRKYPMRRPDHTEAKRYTKHHNCPRCGGNLTPNYEITTIECVDECGWSGESYETIHAVR